VCGIEQQSSGKQTNKQKTANHPTPPNPNSKPQQNSQTPQKQQQQKTPPQPICCLQLYYSTLGVFPHVRIELIKRSALESMLFMLHSIL